LPSSPTNLERKVDVKLTGSVQQGKPLVHASGHAGKFWAKGANLGEQVGAIMVNEIQVFSFWYIFSVQSLKNPIGRAHIQPVVDKGYRFGVRNYYEATELVYACVCRSSGLQFTSEEVSIVYVRTSNIR
jgi:hypothetical protein